MVSFRRRRHLGVLRRAVLPKVLVGVLGQHSVAIRTAEVILPPPDRDDGAFPWGHAVATHGANGIGWRLGGGITDGGCGHKGGEHEGDEHGEFLR